MPRKKIKKAPAKLHVKKIDDHSFLSFTKSPSKAFACYQNYGHFVRDAALWVFYYLDNRGLINDPDHKLVVLVHHMQLRYRDGSKNFYRLNPKYKDFFAKIFSNAIVIKRKKYWDAKKIDVCPNPRYTPEYISWSQKRSDHKLTEGNPFDLNNSYNRRIGTITRHGDDWGGDTALYPKISVDKFRDHCFKMYEIKPRLKKQLLYVPREESTIRFLDDSKLEDMLRDLCKKNNYKFVRWTNGQDTPIKDQMLAYSESEIIVGANGTDFVNSYWTSNEQLIIEIICTDKIPSAGGFSGFSAAFKSKSISKQLLKMYGEDYPRNSGEQDRNWHIIQTPHETNHIVDGYTCKKWHLSKCKIRFETSEKNRLEIQDTISRWTARSSTGIS